MLRRLSRIVTGFRRDLVSRVSKVNGMMSEEVRRAGHELSLVVNTARAYTRESEETLLRVHGTSGIGDLFSRRSELLLSHSADMSARATAQDERARIAALTAKNIAELAISIDRLASETRLLAINARIESSRLGVNSSGFAVLAAEMKRLSDEVARTNERVRELAALLTQSLPAIARHAVDVRHIMQDFATTTAANLADTERAVKQLREQANHVTSTGRSVIEDVLRASQNALSRLQFQDVVAQDLRRLDGWAREAQLGLLVQLDAERSVMAEVPPAEYVTLGEGLDGEPNNTPSAGEVTLFE
jgi:methyl-accepting chemotaxis protein